MSNRDDVEHYTTGGIETIDYIFAKLGYEKGMGYILGNLIKYPSRSDHKGQFVSDMVKIRNYATMAIEFEEQFGPKPGPENPMPEPIKVPTEMVFATLDDARKAGVLDVADFEGKRWSYQAGTWHYYNLNQEWVPFIDYEKATLVGPFMEVRND